MNDQINKRKEMKKKKKIDVKKERKKMRRLQKKRVTQNESEWKR